MRRTIPYVHNGTSEQDRVFRCAEAQELFKAVFGRVRQLRIASVTDFMALEPKWFVDPIGRMTSRAAVEARVQREARS